MTDPAAAISVIDDDPSIRRSLDRLLRSAGYQAALFSSTKAFMARSEIDAVGCLILDIHMRGETGMDLQARLREIGKDIPIIFLTGHGDIPTSVRAMKEGAVDFLTKPVDEKALLDCIRLALARHEQSLIRRGELESILRCVATLTGRERQVMDYVIAGALNKQIARELGIVEKTIKVHRGRMMEKMGVESVAELVRRCSIAGIEPRQLHQSSLQSTF